MMSMDTITIENFRCFGERQTVRLAPLTLLVGENSTGKTSFLALVRALWDLAYRFRVPDFKETPYDLGSFEDIVHRTLRGQPSPEQFLAELSSTQHREGANEEIRFAFEFSKHESAPFPTSRCYERGTTRIAESSAGVEQIKLNLATNGGEWKLVSNNETSHHLGGESTVAWLAYQLRHGHDDEINIVPIRGSHDLSRVDKEELGSFAYDLLHSHMSRPRAGAPTRSRPQRSYEYARPQYDPEGAHIPNLLASFATGDKDEWSGLKEYIGLFGRRAGLFDEINVNQFRYDGAPFQLQVRRNATRKKGLWRNIVDVGYGVSQALPVVAELLFHGEQDVFLFQQPEVHLHPRAQAELGSLLCSFATGHGLRQRYVVETHSDHLINRVRMDVRDGETDLRPEDVLVLYFERVGLDVKIHEVTFDSEGNVDAPDSYREFFRTERDRSIWGPKTK